MDTISAQFWNQAIALNMVVIANEDKDAKDNLVYFPNH